MAPRTVSRAEAVLEPVHALVAGHAEALRIADAIKLTAWAPSSQADETRRDDTTRRQVLDSPSRALTGARSASQARRHP